jgi:hypothetical protein
MNVVANIGSWGFLGIVGLGFLLAPHRQQAEVALALIPVQVVEPRLMPRSAGDDAGLMEEGRPSIDSVWGDLMARAGRGGRVGLDMPTASSGHIFLRRPDAETEGGLLGAFAPDLDAGLFGESLLGEDSLGGGSWGWLADDVERLQEVRDTLQFEAGDPLRGGVLSGRDGWADPLGRPPSLFDD